MDPTYSAPEIIFEPFFEMLEYTRRTTELLGSTSNIAGDIDYNSAFESLCDF